MCSVHEPHTSSIGNAAEGVRGTDSDSKPKQGRFCASFIDFFPLDWFSKVFRPEQKNDGAVSGTPSNLDDAGSTTSTDAHHADIADDNFFRVQSSSGIRHSLSLGEIAVHFPN